MKVLHIINSLHYGGAEKLIRDTVPEYIKHGITTEVLVLYESGEPMYNELTLEHHVRVFSSATRYSVYSACHIFRIRKKIRDYDIVHVHLFPGLYWAALSTIFLKHKTKLILTEHNTVNRRRSHFLLKYVDRFIYRRYDQIIAISRDVQEHLKRHLGKNYLRICIISNGIHLDKLREAVPYTKAALGIPDNARVIIQVASFTAQKDQHTLIKAIASMKQNVHVLLVGDGHLIGDMKQFARSLGVAQRVHFLGYRSDVPQLLKTADISVLSSHYEGFGLVMAEGMAAGNPCVGSNVEGLSEVIGEAGLLFEPENHIMLKQHLEKLLSDPLYYKKIQLQCKERAALYDISFMITSYINMYKKLSNNV